MSKRDAEAAGLNDGCEGIPKVARVEDGTAELALEEAAVAQVECRGTPEVPKVDTKVVLTPVDEAARLIQTIAEADVTALLPPQPQFLKAKVEQLEVFVGGVRFKTSRETLTSVPGSHLAALFQPGGPKEAGKDDKGRYEIPDRPGKHFMFILNYLRDREIDPPANKAVLEEIEAEAKHYGLQELVTMLHAGEAAEEAGCTAVLTEPKEFDGKDFVAVPYTVPHAVRQSGCFSVTMSLTLGKKPRKKPAVVPVFHTGTTEEQVAGSLLLSPQKGFVFCLSDSMDADTNLMVEIPADPKDPLHLGIVFDKPNCSLFLNGCLASSTTLLSAAAIDALLDTDRPLKVGGSDCFGKEPVGVTGTIHTMAVHHRALTPQELAHDGAQDGKEK
eukprot:GGOE01004397.1.p2 GENE.GGOE01004397.1~~GGOE01004397.1.p2  ORF type:complete len:400 (-),score=108.72 GGOE01004397.1:492-1652(-)